LAWQTAQSGCGRPYAHRRAVFYHLQDGRLARLHHYGRPFHTAPRPTFVAGHSPHDDEVLRQATTEGLLVVDDLLVATPPHFPDPAGRSYRSLISVPVRAGSNSFGLLIVDADKPNAFTDRDKATLALVASILAAAYAHCRTAVGYPHALVLAAVPPMVSVGAADTNGCGPL